MRVMAAVGRNASVNGPQWKSSMSSCGNGFRKSQIQVYVLVVLYCRRSLRCLKRVRYSREWI